jgi:hypothetical protein
LIDPDLTTCDPSDLKAGNTFGAAVLGSDRTKGGGQRIFLADEDCDRPGTIMQGGPRNPRCARSIRGERFHARQQRLAGAPALAGHGKRRLELRPHGWQQ